jgi:hypothetical protein
MEALFTECEWRREEDTTPDTFDYGAVYAVVERATHELRKRLHLLINRWLIPATVQSANGLFRFVVEHMLRADLLPNDRSYQVPVTADVFVLVATPSSPATVFEMVIGSDEYTHRHALLTSFVEDVVGRAQDALSMVTRLFLLRTLDDALPTEAGLLSGENDVYVLPILFGNWREVTSKVQMWMPTYHHGWRDDLTLPTGIVRLLLVYCEQWKLRLLSEVEGLGQVALAAAKMFTSQYADRYTDASMGDGFVWGPVHGVAMPCDMELVKVLSDLFSCDASFVVNDILPNRALSPSSSSPAGLVNVAFVIENILFSESRGTLAIPRAMSVHNGRARVRLWTLARKRLRQALALATESPSGVSVRKFQAFAQTCGTSSKCFVHIFHCFHLLMQGVMAGRTRGRSGIKAMERHMGNAFSCEQGLAAGVPFPAASPWSRNVFSVNVDNGDAVMCLADVALAIVDAACSTPETRLPYMSKESTFMRSGNPNCFWNYREVGAPPADTGEPSLLRILNSMVDIAAVNDARVPVDVVRRGVPVELENIAFGKTLPPFAAVLNGLCYGYGKKELSPKCLPMFVLLWNTALVLRRRIREMPVLPPPTAPPSSEETTASAKRCKPSECLACSELCEGAPVTTCEHSMCRPCASVMVERNALLAFVGKGGVSSTSLAACAVPGCGGAVRPDVLPRLLSPEIYAIYLLVLKKGSAARGTTYCYFCGEAAPAEFHPESDGVVFTCECCGMSSCVQCDRASHPGEVCVRKESGKLTPEDLLSRAKIQFCPGCKTPEVKRLNCNHLVCDVCHTDWCWACGVVLDRRDTTTHYRDESPSCVAYSTETEMQRMKSFLQKNAIEAPHLADATQCALGLLAHMMQQTTADI